MWVHTIGPLLLLPNGWNIVPTIRNCVLIVFCSTTCNRSSSSNLTYKWYSYVLLIRPKRVNIEDLNFGIKKPPLKSCPKGKIAVIYLLRFTYAVRRIYFYQNENLSNKFLFLFLYLCKEWP